MTTNTKDYIEKIKKHQQTILQSVSTIINETTKELFENIVDRTPEGNPTLWKYPAPKGYNPGTLKASWGINYNTSLSSRGISFKIGDSSPQYAVIYNDQPYAQRVENGWSTQAPSGMMRISVREYEMLLNNNTRRYKIK